MTAELKKKNVRSVKDDNCSFAEAEMSILPCMAFWEHLEGQSQQRVCAGGGTEGGAWEQDEYLLA